ncbi:hypothetical protein PR002_g21780 [Phytophthora rubi]|uniref:Uncharacterized protein n=1 Tax=Phytophthora rubi TaxID=129364 RepID=A0A6A3JA26_9STRA|nr:hypothetical protein PR002_g21780 [Phytophthora rubi]
MHTTYSLDSSSVSFHASEHSAYSADSSSAPCCVLRFGPPNHILADGVMDSMARVGMCGCGFAVGGFAAMKCATIFDHEHYIAAKAVLGDHTAWTSPFGSAR